jgi:redox-sensitive bicupin YhaK (pirin superfamily)
MQSNSDNQRSVIKRVKGVATSDGAGVSLTRIIGQPMLPRLDPFLMLDFFGSDKPNEYLSGFPAHPHRGFQTVTYMLAGKMRHKDSVGNEGVIEAGGIQWMNAGKGIIHEEMPEQEEGLLQGFQLWVNLPSHEKMSPPNYQDIPSSDVPVVECHGATVKVLAGKFAGVVGPVKTAAVAPSFFDVHLTPTPDEPSLLSIDMDDSHEGFVYVYEGALTVNPASTALDDQLSAGELGVLSSASIEKSQVTLQAEIGCKCIVVFGEPINEPIVQYGPFVMNTQQEIMEAFEAYKNGTLTK